MTHTSLIENLSVFEYRANTESVSRYFEIETCQRRIELTFDREALPGPQTKRAFFSEEAYEYLLRFACGLESQIKGETDVFGQVKTAHKKLIEREPRSLPMDDHARLSALMLKLFEDTKEIRAHYLQGIGGSTYGALARRLIPLQSSDRVLILGAGQIAKAVAPYFMEGQTLTLWNRSQDRLNELKTDLIRNNKAPCELCVSSEFSDLPQLIQDHNVILIATPANSMIDEMVTTSLKTQAESKTLLHLGGQREELRFFETQPDSSSFMNLSDLFEIEKTQNQFRARQIEQAMNACKARALLRSLAKSISQPHSWEDLAYFS